MGAIIGSAVADALVRNGDDPDFLSSYEPLVPSENINVLRSMVEAIDEVGGVNNPHQVLLESFARSFCKWEEELIHHREGLIHLDDVVGARTLRNKEIDRDMEAPDQRYNAERYESGGASALIRSLPIGLIWMQDRAAVHYLSMEQTTMTQGHGFALGANVTFSYALARLADGFQPIMAIQLAKYASSSAVVQENIQYALDAWNRGRDPHDVILSYNTALAHDMVAATFYLLLKFKDDYPGAIRCIHSIEHVADKALVGALTGALIGTHAGVTCIPGSWVNRLSEFNKLSELAEQGYQYSQEVISSPLQT